MTSTSDTSTVLILPSVGHYGRDGHEFLEFEITADGRLRYGNNSNYKNDILIRKEVFLSDIVLDELKSIITSSNIMSQDDENWPAPDKIGKQDLDIKLGNQEIFFRTAQIGSFLEVQESQDPQGLEIFYYLIQDLKCFVFALISLHFRIKPVN